jgi:ketol-acid reductoisomerase
MDFAGTKETVYERSDWPSERLQEYFKNDTLCILGYGSQGHGQGMNARDNGLNVIVGVRKDGVSWKMAQEDGWVRLWKSVLRHEIDVPVRFLARHSSPSRRPSRKARSS